MTTIPPPGDPVWAQLRLRYEQDQESVQQISDSVGLHRIAAFALALLQAWLSTSLKLAGIVVLVLLALALGYIIYERWKKLKQEAV